ncbi:MAG: zinc metallopeptidase, partial [Thiomargarita sp.]|nr:zinc metallopeptidase [Thiomargarita sp.]
VEWDASFKRALPILSEGAYISTADQRAARKILIACALTYVASSLASLLNLWRWIAILRR